MDGRRGQRSRRPLGSSPRWQPANSHPPKPRERHQTSPAVRPSCRRGHDQNQQFGSTVTDSQTIQDQRQNEASLLVAGASTGHGARLSQPAGCLIGQRSSHGSRSSRPVRVQTRTSLPSGSASTQLPPGTRRLILLALAVRRDRQGSVRGHAGSSAAQSGAGFDDAHAAGIGDHAVQPPARSV
jgi:hypothetical protein